MPFWIEHKLKNNNISLDGPFETREEAIRFFREHDNDISVEIVEASLKYKKQLRRAIRIVSFEEGVREVVFSDGTREKTE
jgi:hypothetical protein